MDDDGTGELELVFDFDAVTPRMLIDFERETGVSLMSTLGDNGQVQLADVSASALAGFVWLGMRMSGRPDATYDDALDTPFTALSFAAEVPAEDPTPAG